MCVVRRGELSIENDPRYDESILVHEFDPTVMNPGMDDLGRAMVRRCYDDAMARGCTPGTYWARAPTVLGRGHEQFDATVRTDVNGG